jgi:PAS domain-containing protein
MATLRVRALAALERFPVPTLAVAEDGAVLYANIAFADALGCSRNVLTSMGYEDVINVLPVEETLVAFARLRADPTAELRPLDGLTVYAKMRKSAMVRNGFIQFTTFEDLAVQLSADEALRFSE